MKLAVDAPCGWSRNESIREAEHDLKLFGKKIPCFATPTRERAENNDKGFYCWMFNGENLYQQLREHYQLYEDERCKGPLCIETFPHAVACALAGEIVPARHKASVRRKVLQGRGYDISDLSNIDYVDAALCAIAADEFRRNNFQSFGNREEGFIIVPK